MYKKLLYLLCCTCWISALTHAQIGAPDALEKSADTLVQDKSINALTSKPDTTATLQQVKDSVDNMPFITPKKKALFSAMVPGLGQIYNKHYWKLPIVYGGLGVAGYFIYDNNRKYLYYREIYAGRLSNKQEFLQKESHISTDNIQKLQDAWRQDRDMVVLVTVLGYGLQIMDALVFAHLKDFDISDDIAMKIKPTTIPVYQSNMPALGFGLVFQLKP